MKKLISLLTAFIMLSLTAFAADADDLAAVYEKNGELRSASFEVTLSADTNKPLDILSQIPDEGGVMPYSPQLLAESLFDTKIQLNGSYSISEDYKKMLAEITMVCDAPIVVNEDMKIAAWTRYGMWLEYDLTDPQAPVYRTIIKSPFSRQYTVTDMSGYYAEHPDTLNILYKDNIKELRDKSIKALTDNAKVTKKNDSYTISFNSESAQNYIKTVFSMAEDVMQQNMPEGITADKFYDSIAEFFDKVNVFGKDGIVVTLNTNKDGYITTASENINIAFNVYDAIKAFDKSTEGLDRAKADIDLTIKADCKYSEHNSAKPVLPEINDDNSMTINTNDYQDFGYDGIDKWEDHAGNEPLLIKDNIIYFPYEAMAEQIGLDVKTEVNGDSITVSIGDSYNVDINGNEVTLFGETEAFDFAPVISENGTWYCSNGFLWYVRMDSYEPEYDVKTGTLKYEFWYCGLPEDHSNTEEDMDDYSYKDRRYYSIYSDRALYMANGTAYLPIYDLLESVSPGEYSFDNNGFIYTARYENPLGISTASVYEGDSFVTVNSKRIDIPFAAENVDGVLRVPVSFAESIGLEISNIYMDANAMGSSFYFEVRGAEDGSADDEYYGSDTPVNWFYGLMF